MFFGLLAGGAAASTNLTVDGSHSLAAGVHTFDVLHVTATGTLTINGVVEIIARGAYTRPPAYRAGPRVS